MTFIDRLFIDYPILRTLSIWGSSDVLQPVESIQDLIETCVDEMSSDILVTDTIYASGIATNMPNGTVTVCSATLSQSMPFQGNRLIKVTYDKATNIAYLRFYPATITYQRYMSVEDLNTLKGDRLIYAKKFIQLKMAEKELATLKPVNLTTDNAVVDFSSVEKFIEKLNGELSILKDNVLLYNTVN